MSGYLTTQLSATQIAALTPSDGMIVFNTTTDQFQFHQNGVWVLGVQGNLPYPGIVLTNMSGGIVALSNLIETGAAGNLGLGLSVFPSVTTASTNVAMGYQSQNALTTGTSNCSFGYQTLSANQAGSNTSVVGHEAFMSMNNGSSSNSGFGYQVGYNITTTASANNTFIGALAGSTQTSYNNCTFLGYGADATTGGLSYTTVIGAGATASLSNVCVIGQPNATGYMTVGINIASPIGQGLHIGNAGGTQNPILVIDPSTSAYGAISGTNVLGISNFNGKPVIAANQTQYIGTIVTADSGQVSSALTSGQATLPGGTGLVSVTISTTAISTASLILLNITTGTAAATASNVMPVVSGDIVNGTSFKIYGTGIPSTTQTVNWQIINI